MRDLYDLLRNTIAAELQAKSDEARDQLEYARGAIVEAIVHETRHTDIGGGSDIRTDGEAESPMARAFDQINARSRPAQAFDRIVGTP